MPIAFDIYTGWLLTQRAQAHFAVSLNTVKFSVQFKNEDYLFDISAGPDVICGTDNIIVSFDKNIVADEKLITDDASMVSLLSRDSMACTAMFDHFNFSEYYLIVAPSPLDSTCGSYMEVGLIVA